MLLFIERAVSNVRQLHGAGSIVKKKRFQFSSKRNAFSDSHNRKPENKTLHCFITRNFLHPRGCAAICFCSRWTSSCDKRPSSVQTVGTAIQMAKHQVLPVTGCIHTYAFNKIAFEFAPLGSKKVLVFVGGLMDGLMTVPYLPQLAEELSKIGFSLIQIEITSSHIGWGTGSLSRDSGEIAHLVNYLRSELGGAREVIGLMGHSTGCQNTIHYVTRQPREDVKKFSPIDFGILQAPVSDRYSAAQNMTTEEIAESLQVAEKLISEKRHKEIMPSKFTNHFFGVPINAYRWKSLIAVRGDDDFFSPDLDQADFDSTFGKFDIPLLVLYSGADEYVAAEVNKEELMEKWRISAGSNWSPYSKIVKGALHNIGPGSAPEAKEDAINSVVKFIQSI